MSDEVINLPYGFKKCLFLKGTGTQYINTNYIPTLKTGIKIKWAFDNVFVEDSCPIIGGL